MSDCGYVATAVVHDAAQLMCHMSVILPWCTWVGLAGFQRLEILVKN